MARPPRVNRNAGRDHLAAVRLLPCWLAVALRLGPVLEKTTGRPAYSGWSTPRSRRATWRRPVYHLWASHPEATVPDQAGAAGVMFFSHCRQGGGPPRCWCYATPPSPDHGARFPPLFQLGTSLRRPFDSSPVPGSVPPLVARASQVTPGASLSAELQPALADPFPRSYAGHVFSCLFSPGVKPQCPFPSLLPQCVARGRPFQATGHLLTFVVGGELALLKQSWERWHRQTRKPKASVCSEVQTPGRCVLPLPRPEVRPTFHVLRPGGSRPDAPHEQPAP